MKFWGTGYKGHFLGHWIYEVILGIGSIFRVLIGTLGIWGILWGIRYKG